MSKDNKRVREELIREYKRCAIQSVEDLDTGMEVNIAELEITSDNDIKIKKVHRIGKEKSEREEKRKFQKLRKELEDR